MADVNVRVIIDAVDKASSDIRNVGKSLGGLEKNAIGVGGAFRDVGGTLAGIGGQFFSLGGAIAGVGLAALTIDLAKTGAEAKRYKIALDQVIANTDLTTKEVDQMRIALEQANVVGGQADAVMLAFSRTGLATLRDEAGNLVVNFDDLLLRTKDLAASMGISSKKGVDALIKAIATGNVQMLDQLGVQVNLIATNKAYAESIGKSVSELTLQERQLALINEVMRQGESVAGTYKAVYDQLEKALSSTSDRMREAKEALAVLVEPAITAAVVALRDAFASLRDWANANQASLQKMGQQIAAIVPVIVNGLMVAIQFLLNHKEIILAFFTAIGISIALFIGGLVLLHLKAILIFTALVALLTLFYKAYNTNFLGVKTITDFVVAFVVDQLKRLYTFVQTATKIISAAWAFLSADTSTKWTMIKNTIVNLMTAASNFVMAKAQAILGYLRGRFNEAHTAVSDAMRGLYNAIAGWLERAWNKAREMAAKIKDALKQASPFHRSSPSLVDEVVAGSKKIIDEYANLADKVEDVDLTRPTFGAGFSGDGSGTGSGVTNVTFNFSGNFMGSETEMREFAMGIWDRVGQVAKAENRRPDELLDLTI